MPKAMRWKIFAGSVRGPEWQWRGGSGRIRCGRARRFEWCRWGGLGGSIGGDRADFVILIVELWFFNTPHFISKTPHFLSKTPFFLLKSRQNPPKTVPQPCLKELHLESNRIATLHGSHCQPHLERLWLGGSNPIASHPNYRLMCLMALGIGIRRIDGEPVVGFEREQVGGSGRLTFIK
jgi:hypothetical protein